MGAPTGIDWEWALRSKGALSARQKRQLLAPLARVVAAYPAARLRLATGSRGTTTIDLDALQIPDSSLAGPPVTRRASWCPTTCSSTPTARGSSA